MIAVGAVPNSMVEALQLENLAVLMPELPVVGFALRTSTRVKNRLKFSSHEEPKSKLGARKGYHITSSRTFLTFVTQLLLHTGKK